MHYTLYYKLLADLILVMSEFSNHLYRVFNTSIKCWQNKIWWRTVNFANHQISSTLMFSTMQYICQKSDVTYVTGPAKINHVSANYTKLYFQQYLQLWMWYLISVNFTRKPIKFCSGDRDFIVFVQTVHKLW